MKRLMFLISTEGKSKEQISQEAKLAYDKYQQVSQPTKLKQPKVEAEIYFLPPHNPKLPR